MRFRSFAAGTLLLGSVVLLAQVPDVKALSGKYFFRELALASDTSQVSGVSGTLTFDGNGSFTFQGQQLTGPNGPVTASGSGTYLVNSTGSVVISPDPLRNGSALNARIGAGALVASNTESSSTFFSLMIAIPAPTIGVTNATLDRKSVV